MNWRWLIWLLLGAPGISMLVRLTGGDVAGEVSVVESLLHPTGEFAARFMIIAMLVTPLTLLFSKSRFVAGMLKYRRDIGVAAFVYATFHTVLYIVHKATLTAMLDEFWLLGIWTGWVAFVVFVPLGVTSNRYATLRLGQTWKTLQRSVYVAAVATLVHWIFVENNLGPALVHFVPLALLELYRIWRNRQSVSTESLLS